MDLKPNVVALDVLLLDPNNYRYRDLAGYAAVDEQRFHEPRVQARANEYLRNTEAFGLAALRDSIYRNGYIPLDRIVVRRYPHSEGLYVVVEGNRRVAALRWLRENHEHGVVTLDQEVYERLASVEALELSDDSPEEGAAEESTRIIMAIRHVAGVKEWGAYQQARLIVELIEAGVDVPTISQQLGMETRDVNRRFRASKALEQMEEDEDFGDYATPQLYAIFQEVISRPKLRAWFGWSDDTTSLENAEHRTQLYEWLSPGDGPDGSAKAPKIGSSDQARSLPKIIDSADALAILSDADRTYEDAYAAAYREAASASALSELEYALKRAASAIENLPAPMLAELSEENVALMNEVTDSIAKQLEFREKLVAG